MNAQRNLLQTLIARGAVMPPQHVVPVECVIVSSDDRVLVVGGTAIPETALAPDHGLAVLLPSYVDRCDEAEHIAVMNHLLDRLAEVHDACPGLPISLWVGLQWRLRQRDESIHRLTAMLRCIGDRTWLSAVGLSLPGPGKLRTTNAAIRAAAPSRPIGWLWVDDDVYMEPGCLRDLVVRFLDRGARGAVGATKVGQPKSYRTSRFMHRLARITAPHRDYPNALCMVVESRVVAGGVPEWLDCDDGFVLFELLDPSGDDPWQDLEVVDSARCRYFQASTAGETIRRLHRAIYRHLLHVAHYPWPSGREYLAQTLFYGLWPLAPWDDRRGPWAGAVRWAVKAVQFAWFSGIAAAMVMRGLIGRPRPPRSYEPYAQHWSTLSSADG